MGEDVDRLVRFLSWRDRLDQGQAVPADRLVDRDVFLGDFTGALVGSLLRAPKAASGISAFRISSSAHFKLIAVGRVAINIAQA